MAPQDPASVRIGAESLEDRLPTSTPSEPQTATVLQFRPPNFLSQLLETTQHVLEGLEQEISLMDWEPFLDDSKSYAADNSGQTLHRKMFVQSLLALESVGYKKTLQEAYSRMPAAHNSNLSYEQSHALLYDCLRDHESLANQNMERWINGGINVDAFGPENPQAGNVIFSNVYWPLLLRIEHEVRNAVQKADSLKRYDTSAVIHYTDEVFNSPQNPYVDGHDQFRTMVRDWIDRQLRRHQNIRLDTIYRPTQLFGSIKPDLPAGVNLYIEKGPLPGANMHSTSV